MSTSPRNRARGVIIADGPNILVFAPYDAKDDIKDLPTRRWDRERRCWVEPKQLRNEVRRILERWCTAIDDRSDSATEWPVEMFASIPNEHVNRVYRALSVVLHPDHGGSTQLMAAVNRAHDARVQAMRRPS